MLRLPAASLRVRLLLLVLLAVVPAIGLMLYIASQDRASAAAAAQTDALRVVRQAAKDQADLMAQARQILTEISLLSSLRGGGAPLCSAVFGDLRAQYLKVFPRYANLGLIGAEGRIYCSVVPVNGPVDVGRQAAFQQTLSNLQFTVGAAYLDPAVGRSFVNFFYPVLSFDGGVRLVLFATLDLEWLNQLAADAALPEGSTLAVIDPAGVILARYPDPDQWVGKTFPLDAIVTTPTGPAGEGTAEVTGADGVPYLFAYTALNPDTGGGETLTVSVGIPAERVFAQANRALVGNLLALGFIVVIALIVTWVGGDLFVVRPVDRLLQATRRLEAGDLQARTGLSERGQGGELGQLARAFDRMAAALEEREQERQAAETALRESERRYRTLAENFPNGAVLLFDHDLRYTLADGAGLADVGLSPEQLEGRTIREVFAPAVSAALEPPFRAALAGTPSEFEVPFADRIYVLHVLPLRDEHGRITAGLATTQDITARKRSEQELREREQQYRSIFESSADGLFINDLDGSLVDFNPAAARMHGYTPEEFRRLQPGDFIHADSQRLFAEYLAAVRAGREFRGRAMDVRKDGSTFHVEVTGVSFTYLGRPHMLAVVRDISAQVQAEQILEQRVEERTRQLSTLLQVARNVTSTLELEPLLGQILDQLRAVVDYRHASLYILEDEDHLVLLQERGDLGRVGERATRPDLREYAATRAMLERGEPLVVADLDEDSDLARDVRASLDDDAELNRRGAIASWISVPLRARERSVGMLNLGHPQAGHYTPERARLAMAFAAQAAVAIENANLYRRAGQLAALEERQKLARELHDSVSQALYGIALGARTARTLLTRGSVTAETLTDPLDYVLSLAEAGLAEMRALIFELRPESLRTEGLVAALTKQADSLRARHRLEVQTDFSAEPAAPLELKEALYRIAQEALHNIGKHARASRVEVRLEARGDALALTIADDGVGFDPHGHFPGHLGLRSMRERAERVRAAFHIDSAPGRGTRLRVETPSNR